MHVRIKSLQLCPTLCDPMDCSPPGSSAHGILQGRILERVAMLSSRRSSQPRERTLSSALTGGFFYKIKSLKKKKTSTQQCSHDCMLYIHTHTIIIIYHQELVSAVTGIILGIQYMYLIQASQKSYNCVLLLLLCNENLTFKVRASQ